VVGLVVLLLECGGDWFLLFCLPGHVFHPIF